MSRPSAAAGQWHELVAASKDAGFCMLVDLVAVDEVGHSDEICVVARLLNPDTGEAREIETRTAREHGSLPDITDLFAGAAWLQRQIHDLFDIGFDGADLRPLIWHGAPGALRKDSLLPQRLATRWPGALEPGESDSSPGRRKLVPPGVPDPAIVADAGATPAEVALSATGVRVRRLP